MGVLLVQLLLAFVLCLPIYAAPLDQKSQLYTRKNKPEWGPDHGSGSSAFGSIRGPVISGNFPDPAILFTKGTSYAFATNDKGRHIQLATSTDNVTWSLTGQDALPTVGGWETGSAVWAPDVVRLDNGKYVLYYTDEPKTAIGHHCIGAGISSHPQGPYSPLNSSLICPDPSTKGGAIDPEGFRDPATGKRYIIYKIDGNSLGHGGSCGNTVQPIVSTPLMLQEVATDGITLIGSPVQLLDRDSSDGPLIEAPAVHRTQQGIYFLFYSSNCYSSSGYDVKYATATSISGPFTKATSPLLKSGDGPNLNGPGGLDIAANSNFVVFHAITSSSNSTLVRSMYTATVTFQGRTAFIT